MKNFLQKLGKSLMLPISVLPVVSILFGIGYAIDSTVWGHGNIVAGLMIKSGLALIENIPILFAVGIPVGLSKERDGVSALSGLVGFLIIQNILNPKTLAAMGKIQLDLSNGAFTKINNVFIGIVVGILVSLIYNRFSRTELPSALSFFSGRRLIPIITVFTMILVSVILYFIWPALYNLLVSIGENISSLGATGAGIYGFLNRLLIPTGLHHALNAVFWFDTVNINDLGNFWSNVGVKGITGRYMSGFFPIMMFGLPGACLAIYSTALEKHKKSVGSMLLAVSFSAFLVGLTEPIEFLFMFLSPLLFIVHALLTAVSMFVAVTMHWTAGFNFSAGLIDWVLSSGTPMANHPEMLLVLGLVMFFVYFLVFRTLILKFDLKTPGRSDTETNFIDIDKNSGKTSDPSTVKTSDSVTASKLILGLGGSDNIENIDYCATRLRVKINDISKIDRDEIIEAGAINMIKVGNENVQIIIGQRVQFIYDAIKKLLD